MTSSIQGTGKSSKVERGGDRGEGETKWVSLLLLTELGTFQNGCSTDLRLRLRHLLASGLGNLLGLSEGIALSVRWA